MSDLWVMRTSDKDRSHESRPVSLRPAASRCVPLVAMIARLRDRMWVGVGRKNGRNAERNRHRLHRVGK